MYNENELFSLCKHYGLRMHDGKIDYHTWAGNTTAETLEEAMRIADRGAAYTGEDISIYDDDDREVMRRRWWGSCNEDEIDAEDDPIVFGTFGFYGGWAEC